MNPNREVTFALHYVIKCLHVSRCYFLKHVSAFCPCLASVVPWSPRFSPRTALGGDASSFNHSLEVLLHGDFGRCHQAERGVLKSHLSSPCSFELHSSQFAKFKLSFSRKALYPDRLNQASPSSSSWPFRNLPSINYRVCHQVIKISTPCHQIIFLKKCSSFPVNNQKPCCPRPAMAT